MIRHQVLLTCLLVAAYSPATEPAENTSSAAGAAEHARPHGWSHGAMVSAANPDAVAAAIAVLETGWTLILADVDQPRNLAKSVTVE